jgi:hypothetical protein
LPDCAQPGVRSAIPSETADAGTVDFTVLRGGFEAVTAVHGEGASPIASDGVTAIGRLRKPTEFALLLADSAERHAGANAGPVSGGCLQAPEGLC